MRVFCVVWASLFVAVHAVPLLPNTYWFSAPTLWRNATAHGSDAQRVLDALARELANGGGQFVERRVALLFEPGRYALDITVGYYTQLLGLGVRPDDVTITGVVQVPNQPGATGALVNFWRGAENIRFVPPQGTLPWLVSQASPLRRVVVDGSVVFGRGGYSSGGFMSDSYVVGSVFGGTQQQWMCRNNHYAQWVQGNWNQVSLGDDGPLPSGQDSQQCVPGRSLWTSYRQTEVIAAKPFVRLSATNKLVIAVSPVRINAHGPPEWGNVTLVDFYTARAGVDTAATINAELARGSHVLLAPGVFELDAPLRVVKNGTVVLGVGLATLRPMRGTAAMQVLAYECRIAGILFDAGPNQTPVSPLLLQVGAVGNECLRARPRRPTILSDIYARVGGRSNAAAVNTMVSVHQDDVIIDNAWLWRADHNQTVGEGLGPHAARVQHALRVEACNVRAYGLAAEHTLKELVLWNGDNGMIKFCQIELPYDVPSTWNLPAIRLGAGVSNFFGQGIGVYSFFNPKFSAGAGPQPTSAIAVPSPIAKNIVVPSAMVLFLAGHGGTQHVVNSDGPSATSHNADSPQWCSLNAKAIPNACPAC